MKTILELDGQLLREAATRADSEARMPAQPGEETLRDRLRATSAPARLHLLVKPGWLKPGIDIDVDSRNALYDQLDGLD